MDTYTDFNLGLGLDISNVRDSAIAHFLLFSDEQELKEKVTDLCERGKYFHAYQLVSDYNNGFQSFWRNKNEHRNRF